MSPLALQDAPFVLILRRMQRPPSLSIHTLMASHDMFPYLTSRHLPFSVYFLATIRESECVTEHKLKKPEACEERYAWTAHGMCAEVGFEVD